MRSVIFTALFVLAAFVAYLCGQPFNEGGLPFSAATAEAVVAFYLLASLFNQAFLADAVTRLEKLAHVQSK